MFEKNNENQLVFFRFYAGIADLFTMLCRMYKMNVILLIICTKVRELPSFQGISWLIKVPKAKPVVSQTMQFTEKLSNIWAQTR